MNIMGKKKNIEKNTPLSLANLHSFHDEVSNRFAQKWENASRNEGRMLADNWTEQQKKDFAAQDRLAFSMPTSASALHRISATQKQSRQSWKIEAASDPNDEIGAEIATIVLRDYEKKQDMAHIESDVFDDGTGITFGADKFELKNVLGKDTITNRKVDYLNLVWDLNDITYDLDEVLFIAEVEKMAAFELEAQGYDVQGFDDTSGTLMGRPENDYWGTGVNEARTVSVFHHYHRTKKKYYVVIFKDSQGLFNFPNVVIKKTRSQKEAKDLLKQIEFFYSLNGLDTENELSIETEEVFEYDYYKFTYTQILEYEETGETFHPYNLFFAIRVANDWISVLDFMSSPQIFTDRIWSQVDYSFRSELKNAYEVNINALADGETKESAQKKLMKTGGVIGRKGDKKIFDPIISQGFNPQYMQIIGIMQQSLTDMLGGANAQGGAETSNESGRAVALRQAQGKLVAFLFLDNLTRYKQKKGEKLLKLVKKHDSTERVIKILGGELDENMMLFLQQSGNLQPSISNESSFLTINKGIASFQNADLDLVVDVAPMNEYERAAKLEQYTLAEQNAPYLLQSPTWIQLKLQLLDIPKTDRAKLIQEAQIIMQQQQEMAQAEINNQRSESVKNVSNSKEK